MPAASAAGVSGALRSGMRNAGAAVVNERKGIFYWRGALRMKSPLKRSLSARLARDKYLYLLALPGIAYYILFHYVPMYGITIAFQNFSPFRGFSGSEWVGLAQFRRLFTHPDFWLILRNTFAISILNLLFFYPVPIVLALLLNEVRSVWFKRGLQTVLYLPHFVSWVVICSLTISMLNSQGALTQLFRMFGVKTQFLMDKSVFWGMITIQNIWKDAGWGTIIFLAALAGINPELYEAARVDGANRWRQMISITLPGIMGTIVITLILRLGHILSLSFDQLYLMGNPLVRDVSEVFDTYVYITGVLQGNFSFATAVGLFKSVVGLTLILAANYLARKTSDNALF
jgi:putative aldouronate transport system permease protein